MVLARRIRRPPDAPLDVVGRDDRVRRGVPPLRVDEPRRVEDLRGLVRVERRHDLRDRAEVAVEELAQPAVVVRERPARTARSPACRTCSARRSTSRQIRRASSRAAADPVQRRPRPPPPRPARRTGRDGPPRPARIPVRRQRQLHRASVLMPSVVAADARRDASRLADATRSARVLSPGCRSSSSA